MHQPAITVDAAPGGTQSIQPNRVLRRIQNPRSATLSAMAPAGPRSPARKRIKTAPGVTLPPDMLFEVFLNLPASSVCRFRAVCRSWRAVLSGRSFLAAHAARRGPLLLAAGPYRSCPRSWHVDLVDLAGTVARRRAAPLCSSRGSSVPVAPSREEDTVLSSSFPVAPSLFFLGAVLCSLRRATA